MAPFALSPLLNKSCSVYGWGKRLLNELPFHLQGLEKPNAGNLAAIDDVNHRH